MKVCHNPLCLREPQPLCNFYKNRKNADRLDNICKGCSAVKMAKWRQANADKFQLSKVNWRRAHPELVQAMRNQHRAERRAAEANATPCWLTQMQRKQIQKIYREAVRLTRETGIKYHVDHIVPLRGKNLCGLHVPWNLQVLPASENLKKNNKLVS